MTQEDKELLLKDLSARLPYGVKGVIMYDKSNTTFTVEGIDNNVLHLSDAEECYVEDFKPYLRPMSSMTEEEKQWSRWYQHDAKSDDFRLYVCQYVEWLDSNHFDWRTDGNGKTMIERGLALETPEGMYNIKEK